MKLQIILYFTYLPDIMKEFNLTTIVYFVSNKHVQEDFKVHCVANYYLITIAYSYESINLNI